MKNLRSIDRILIAIAIGVPIGGIFSLAIAPFVPPTDISYILAMLVSTGGTLLGMALNWTPSIPKGAKHHIIYEPDEEDSFDREIEDALKGKYD